MRKFILLSILIIILVACSVSIYFINIDTIKDNKGYYEYFMNEKLVGVDGNINLSSIKLEHDNLYKELLDKFEQDSYDYNNFLIILEEEMISGDDMKKK